MAVKITTKELKEIIRWTINSGLHQPILALGAPGIGKSECIHELVDEFNERAGRDEWQLIDLRLAQMSEVEIAGLIFPTEDKQHTQWLLPDWFARCREKKTILLLDELTSATKRVQVAAYQLVLDRRLGAGKNAKLPDDTVIVALGNRADDNGVVVELAAPLANRFEIYEIKIDVQTWIDEYASVYVNPKTGKGFNPAVTAYISTHRDKLHTQTEDAEEMVFASPRTWNRVSDIMNGLPEGFNIAQNRAPSDPDYVVWNVARNKIAASVGDVIAADFIAQCKHEAENLIVKNVLATGQGDKPANDTSNLYIVQSLVSSINGAAKSDEQEAGRMYKNATQYVTKCIKPEYASMFDISLAKTIPSVIANALSQNNAIIEDASNARAAFNNELQEVLGEASDTDGAQGIEMDVAGIDAFEINVF